MRCPEAATLCVSRVLGDYIHGVDRDSLGIGQMATTSQGRAFPCQTAHTDGGAKLHIKNKTDTEIYHEHEKLYSNYRNNVIRRIVEHPMSEKQ